MRATSSFEYMLSVRLAIQSMCRMALRGTTYEDEETLAIRSPSCAFRSALFGATVVSFGHRAVPHGQICAVLGQLAVFVESGSRRRPGQPSTV